MSAHLFHASCVALPENGGCGVLLLGPSGCGKSSLALELLHAGGRLVSDDQTLVTGTLGGLEATAPETLRGLIELHGYGLLQVPTALCAPSARLALVVTFMPLPQPIERLPDNVRQPLLTMPLPHLPLRPYDPAAVAKIMAVLRFPVLDVANG